MATFYSGTPLSEFRNMTGEEYIQALLFYNKEQKRRAKEIRKNRGIHQ